MKIYKVTTNELEWLGISKGLEFTESDDIAFDYTIFKSIDTQKNLSEFECRILNNTFILRSLWIEGIKVLEFTEDQMIDFALFVEQKNTHSGLTASICSSKLNEWRKERNL